MATTKKPARNHETEKKVAYGDGGATRSKMLERYDLIPPVALRELAKRYGLGAEKHGEGNWKHGDKEFVKAIINHAFAHMNDIMRPDSKEGILDNCGAIGWAAAALAWYQENRPKLVSQAILELQDGLVEKKS